MRETSERSKRLILSHSRFEGNEDETISIQCPDQPRSTQHMFYMSKSAMMRSPVLANFFSSEDYLYGCKMLLTLIVDPAVCFQVVKHYLEEGPDVYNIDRLRVYVTISYTVVERFCILARLYWLAKKLSLVGLMGMAYQSMLASERLMGPQSCIAVAKLIYAGNGGYDRLLKDWCLKHIGHHFTKLREMAEWPDVLHFLSPELGTQWDKLERVNRCVLATLKGAADEETLEEMMSNMAKTGAPGVISAIETRLHHMTFDEAVKDVMAEGREQSDDDWEAVEKAFAKDSSPKSTRGRAMLGLIDTNVAEKYPDTTTPWAGSSPVFSMETAKARTVMGIDYEPRLILPKKRAERGRRGGLRKFAPW